MAGTNLLVTESFLASNFNPKVGHTPGSNNTIILDCDTILSRYNVTIQGITSTGGRCPSQNEIVSSIQTITTLEIQYNSSTNISTGGFINNATPPVQEFGVCWSVSVNPTISNNFEIYGTNQNLSTFTWSGVVTYIFSPGTTYYLKAYAKVNNVYYYGNQQIVNTSSVTTTTTTNNVPACFNLIGEEAYITISESSTAWCADTTKIAHIMSADTPSITTATKIYTGSDCVTYANAGYYGISLSGNWRYWNGTSFTSSGTCPVSTTTTTEPTIWYILWYNCQSSSNDRQSGPYTESYVNSIFIYNRRYYDSGGNSYCMSNAANASWGQASVTVTYTNNETGCPAAGSGYYDCGYGCQYYAYYPGCTTCNPASTTTTTTLTYYGYLVDVYICNTCELPIDTNVLIQDTNEFLLFDRYYADSYSGNVYRIVNNNQSLGGLLSNCVGSPKTSCAAVTCVV